MRTARRPNVRGGKNGKGNGDQRQRTGGIHPVLEVTTALEVESIGGRAGLG